MRLVPIYEATLSTYFLPTAAPSPPPGYVVRRRELQSYVDDAGGDPSEWLVTLPSSQLAALEGILDAHHAGHAASNAASTSRLAACTRSMVAAAAPLPCRTGVNPIRCVDGARACGDGAENGRRPFLELDFEDYEPDFNGKMYLFAVHFKIPADEQLGSLLFHPPEVYGGDAQANRGWELTAYGASHNPLPVQCQDWNVGSNVAEHSEGLTHVVHACLPATATDSDYDAMSKARFLRITLIGEFRQIWLDTVDVYFRAISVGDPRPVRIRDSFEPPIAPWMPTTPACVLAAAAAPASWRRAAAPSRLAALALAAAVAAMHDARQSGLRGRRLGVARRRDGAVRLHARRVLREGERASQRGPGNERVRHLGDGLLLAAAPARLRRGGGADGVVPVRSGGNGRARGGVKGGKGGKKRSEWVDGWVFSCYSTATLNMLEQAVCSQTSHFCERSQPPIVVIGSMCFVGNVPPKSTPALRPEALTPRPPLPSRPSRPSRPPLLRPWPPSSWPCRSRRASTRPACRGGRHQGRRWCSCGAGC